MNLSEICAQCGHERFHHMDNKNNPTPCVAKDLGEGCQGFVRSSFTLRAMERARLVAADERGAVSCNYSESPSGEWWAAFLRALGASK